MARYTTELRTICETVIGLKSDVGLTQTRDVIKQARSIIFDFDYPIFDNAYKAILEQKIIKHYYFREIGLENYGQFKFFLDTKLNEIMPYYNQLYKSALLEFSPFYDVDITREHNRTRDDKGNRTSLTTTNGTSNSKTNSSSTSDTTTDDTSQTGTAFSDTPQGNIDNVKNLKYLTTYQNVQGTVGGTSNTVDEGNSRTDNTINNTINDKADNTLNSVEDYLESVKGKQGTSSYSKMLMEYRDTFLNIDMMVIEELGDLFMTIY